MIPVSKPDFSIGKLLATPAALEALQEADVDLIDLVERIAFSFYRNLTNVFREMFFDLK